MEKRTLLLILPKQLLSIFINSTKTMLGERNHTVVRNRKMHNQMLYLPTDFNQPHKCSFKYAQFPSYVTSAIVSVVSSLRLCTFNALPQKY